MKLHYSMKMINHRRLKRYSYLRIKVHLYGDNHKKMFQLDENEQINKIVAAQYVTTILALIRYDSLVISRLS